MFMHIDSNDSLTVGFVSTGPAVLDYCLLENLTFTLKIRVMVGCRVDFQSESKVSNCFGVKSIRQVVAEISWWTDMNKKVVSES